MKILPFIILLSACSSVYSSDALDVFNSKIRLTSSCEMEHEYKGESVKVNLGFSNTHSCRIVTHSNTSIPSTYYINGYYILFIESNNLTSDNCTSEYTAIGIDRDNKLLTTNIVKRSGSCNQEKELKSFEYFSHKLKVNP